MTPMLQTSLTSWWKLPALSRRHSLSSRGKSLSCSQCFWRRVYIILRGMRSLGGNNHSMSSTSVMSFLAPKPTANLLKAISIEPAEDTKKPLEFSGTTKQQAQTGKRRELMTITFNTLTQLEILPTKSEWSKRSRSLASWTLLPAVLRLKPSNQLLPHAKRCSSLSLLTCKLSIEGQELQPCQLMRECLSLERQWRTWITSSKKVRKENSIMLGKKRWEFNNWLT